MTTKARDERTPASDAVAHYESLLRQHGEVSAGVGWNSDQAQQERFIQLSRIFPDRDVPLSVLDFGCGLGAFGEFLAARRQHVTYVGYDASSDMIERARNRVTGPAVRFESDWESVPRCDYAVASGVFNVRGSWSDERWLAYVHHTLRSIHARVGAGWSANFLTTYSDPHLMRPELFYADPLALFDWCKRSLSPFVALNHDYRLFDFTILVRMEPR